MKKNMVVKTLCVLFLSSVQAYELTVTPKHVCAKEGDTSQEFVCTINQGFGFLISHPLKWEKVSRDGTVQTISVLANVVRELETEYSVTIKSGGDKNIFKLTFLEGIKKKYDGHFRCALYGMGDNLIAEATTEVHVLS